MFRRAARMYYSSAVRPLAALALIVAALEALFSAATPNEPGRERLLVTFAPPAVPALAHLLAIVTAVLLLTVVPSVWRGTRLALRLAVILLVLLGVLNLVKGLDYDETIMDVGLAAMLLLARGFFVFGSGPARRLAIGMGVVGIWAATYAIMLVGLVFSDRGHTVSLAFRQTLGASIALPDAWRWAVEAVIVTGLLASLRLVRSLLRPAHGDAGHSEADHAAARALVRSHGRDSLARFILREDKAFHFDAGGVLAYRVVGETAVISGDPVGPAATVPRVLESFIALARERGWQVVLWGASERHLSSYRQFGLRHLHIGNEAFVDPENFNTEGRRMRKVRQSVHRIERRGWMLQSVSGRELAPHLMVEVGDLEEAWRAQQRRVIGFAMGMGPWEAEHQPDDLYLLGRSPDGQLRAVMRFLDHPGGLSLDAMRRVGETPNGLNEALVVRALELARERGVGEVSLNFAGFAHLMAAEVVELDAHRRLARFLLRLVGNRFQMERLVRFNQKFLPEWRPRFLVYDSRTRLPRLGLRVLQAEAYLPGPKSAPPLYGWRPQGQGLGGGAGRVMPRRASGAG